MDEQLIMNEMNNADDINLDDLENNLEQALNASLSELSFLEKEKELINNPDHLGETVMNVVWEQFVNQVAITAGEDFIKENHGLKLDLSDEAHVQTVDNFAKGNIATHNYISKEQLEENYDRYTNMPHGKFRDKYVEPGMNSTLKRAGQLHKKGIDTVTDIYTGKQIPTKTKLENGKNNPDAAQREHVKPSAGLYKNPSLQMANDNDKLAAIINNPENLQGYTTAERNNRKSDSSADEMSEFDKNSYWEKADKRAEKFIKETEKEGDERLRKEGRKTQQEEAFRIGGKALRTALMTMFAALIKEIIGKLVHWFKSSEKSLGTFIEHIKLAVKSFINKLKNLLINISDSVLTTIAATVFDPVISTIKKAFILLKQGWASLKEAIAFLRAPENREKPLSYLLPQVGIIVVTGLTGIGALVLGEGIEKALMGIPFMAVDIPLLGSLANLIGTLMGAIVCGILGAIAINLINKYVAEQQRNENAILQINKKNEILGLQDQVTEAKVQRYVSTKRQSLDSMRARHQAAKPIIEDAMANIFKEDEGLDAENDELDRMLQSYL